jgi:L-lysine 6-transaminase
MTTATRIAAADAVEVLRRHMLVDGFDLVLDLDRSHGSTLVDARTGKEFLDFFTFIASNALGMNHPALAEESFRARLGRVSIQKPSNSDLQTVEMAEFVEAFERFAMPPEFPYLFLVEGGSVAIENALKAAFDWKVRKNFKRGHKGEVGTRVIHFREAFHGRTGYTLSLTNTDPAKTDYYPKFDWPRIDNPKVHFPLDAVSLAQVQDAEARSIEQIEAAFRKYPDDIAAIILEPIQGEGGDNHFRPEFFQALRRLADQHEALLIFDEVQTGVGLTGRFWAYQHLGMAPDIVVFAKKMQVCGMMVSRRIDEVPENVFKVSSRINSTWGGSLTDCVRATRILEVIAADRLVENAATQGARLLTGLQSIAAERPTIVTNARGRGLMCAFDLPDPETRKKLFAWTYDAGLFVLPSGRRSIRFRPALTIGETDIDRGLEILRRGVKALA